MSAGEADGGYSAFDIDIDVDGLPALEWCWDCQRARLTCVHRDRTGEDLTQARSAQGEAPAATIAHYVQDARLLLAEDKHVRADLTLKALLTSLDTILEAAE